MKGSGWAEGRLGSLMSGSHTASLVKASQTGRVDWSAAAAAVGNFNNWAAVSERLGTG
jgi:carbon monoxide dehydrogenase subunit G